MKEILFSLIDNTLKKDITYDVVVELFYHIGNVLIENKSNYYTLFRLEDMFLEKYGKTIIFSKKNLNTMIKFSNNYDNLKKIKLIDWNTHLLILNKKEKEKIIDIAINYKLNKRELEYYLKNKKFKKIEMKYEDPATSELKKVKQYIIENNKR